MHNINLTGYDLVYSMHTNCFGEHDRFKRAYALAPRGTGWMCGLWHGKRPYSMFAVTSRDLYYPHPPTIEQALLRHRSKATAQDLMGRNPMHYACAEVRSSAHGPFPSIAQERQRLSEEGNAGWARVKLSGRIARTRRRTRGKECGKEE